MQISSIPFIAITFPTGKTARFFSIVSASNHEELMKRVQFLKKKLKIVVLTDRGEQGPIWR